MVGKGHMRWQQLTVRWAESRGALGAAERYDVANITDLHCWHEHQEIRGRMTEESTSRFVTRFVVADGNLAMVNEREIFSILARVAWDVRTRLHYAGEVH